MGKYEYNTFIIGAGFSAAADLPLGDSLMKLIINESKRIPIKEGYNETLYDTILKPDIEAYLWYKSLCGVKLDNEEQINLEDFISYLDLNNYLILTGESWSKEGERSQILIRNLIAKVLYNKEMSMPDEKRTLYDNFAKQLKPNDLVLTFNYDTILDNALKRNNIPFRYNGFRYKEINDDGSGILDDVNEDVIFLKMHGSIHWFSKDNYDHSIEYHTKNGNPHLAYHTIFKNPYHFNPQIVIKGCAFPDDPLNNVYEVSNLAAYFDLSNLVTECPLIISPSFNKLIHMQKLRDFWRGFNETGIFSKNFVIIGFSLPSHDEYIRLPLFRAIYNFQYSDYYTGRGRNKLKVIDFKKTDEEKKVFKKNYSILDESKTDFYFEAFDENIVGKLLQNL